MKLNQFFTVSLVFVFSLFYLSCCANKEKISHTTEHVSSDLIEKIVPIQAPFTGIASSVGKITILHSKDQNNATIKGKQGILSKIDIFVDNNVLYLQPKKRLALTLEEKQTTELIVGLANNKFLSLKGLSEFDLGTIQSSSFTLETTGALTLTGHINTTQDISINTKGYCELDLTLNTPLLEIITTGTESIHTSGNVDTQNIIIRGASTYSGQKLHSATTHLDLTGSGQVFINAEKVIDGTAQGTSKIYYSGNPKCMVKTFGTAEIIHQN